MVDPFTAISRFLFDQALRLDSGRTESGKPDWPAGTRLDALVRAVAAPARALLQIGDQLVDARLPSLPKPGERLMLRVVEPYPRLVFALEGPGEAPQDRSTTQVNLSATARILGEVVGRQSEAPGRRPLPLAQVQALPLPSAGKSASHGEDIARQLQQSLEKSGLFYEKHQARWVAGDYPLTELRQEPQAQRTSGAGAPGSTVPGHTGGPAQTPGGPGQAPGGAAQIPGGTGREAPLAQLDANAADSAAETPTAAQRLPAETRAATDTPLRGQLELLDGRGLTVALPAWAGRELHWELPEREPHDESGEAPAWSTHLAVELPGLGAVQAHLRISGNGLALAVTSASVESSQRLAAAQADLMQALRDAGLQLNQLSIVAEHG